MKSPDILNRINALGLNWHIFNDITFNPVESENISVWLDYYEYNSGIISPEFSNLLPVDILFQEPNTLIQKEVFEITKKFSNFKKEISLEKIETTISWRKGLDGCGISNIMLLLSSIVTPPKGIFLLKNRRFAFLDKNISIYSNTWNGIIYQIVRNHSWCREVQFNSNLSWCREVQFNSNLYKTNESQ